MDRKDAWKRAGPAAFSDGLKRLATATRQALDDLTLDVYAETIVPETDPVEWAAFVKATLAAGRWKWFPKTHEIQDALREFRGWPSLESEATLAYERVVAASFYTSESGASWDYRHVRETCGQGAAEAFLAAGGSSAFETVFYGDLRRAAFVAAYQLAA